MHTPRWRECVAELCRVARRSVVLDYPSAHSAALAAVGRPQGAACGRRADRAVSRVLRRRDRRRAAAARLPHSIGASRSSCCRSPCTRPSARARFTQGAEARAGARSDCSGCSDRLSRSSQNGARPRNRRHRLHGWAPGARPRRARPHRSRAGPRSARRAGDLAASRRRTGRPAICATGRRSMRPPRGVDVVYNIAAIYRQAGLATETYRAVNATAVGDVIEAAAQRRRAPGRALQHGRRPRRRRAPAGQRRRAAQARRRLPGNQARRRAARARHRSAPGRRSHHRPADRHLRARRSPAAEAVSRRRARRFCRYWDGERSTTISPTSTISWRAFDSVASIRRQPAAPTSSPAAR